MRFPGVSQLQTGRRVSQGWGSPHKPKIAGETAKAGSQARRLSKAGAEREGVEEAGRVSPRSRILRATEENFSKEQAQSMSTGTEK